MYLNLFVYLVVILQAVKDSLSQAKQKALEHKGQSNAAAGGSDFDMSALAGAMGGKGEMCLYLRRIIS